ncbi:hypothetical protein OW492_07820 [Psychromonas sp. 14N.309.X.WAT.B.A12]|uniref:hypothetical protein n=1 Tax=Psychromonas sp. 14N.309.X.WAT.B.A12 TaxID=2998322 RepID=UPI0025B240CD|nr:hypothetical protein [Psychromonas sp. 14N.309.X.WAT.B.A12]MDN2663280.1 hypothetical protein [Psychromonas sp. 14N.309.X.WAT.B.A12]
MQLSAVDTIRKSLIVGKNGQRLNDSLFKGRSSVDLSVREIIHKNEKGRDKIVGQYFIEPQETVYLLSEEIINVKAGYVAYVFLKNRLSSKGLLALNTGILDSGFHGPLSTLVINFSKQDVPVNENGKSYFFRVVFHKIDLVSGESESDFKGRKYEYDSYKKNKKKELSFLPRLFLDQDKLKLKINSELSDKAMDFGYKKLTLLFAIMSLLFVFIPPLSKVTGDYFFENKNKYSAKVIELSEKFDLFMSQADQSSVKDSLNILYNHNLQLNSQLVELRAEVEALNHELSNIKLKVIPPIKQQLEASKR